MTSEGHPSGYTTEEAEALVKGIKSANRVPMARGFEIGIAFNAWLKDNELLIGEDRVKQINEPISFEPYIQYFSDWALSQPDIGVKDAVGKLTGLPEVLLIAEGHIDTLVENSSDQAEIEELLKKKQLLREKLRRNGWKY